MWWLLLVWIESDVYAAHSVHATVEGCAAQQVVGDRCVQVELKFLEVPPPLPVTVTELPEKGS